jgi:hypothetical protein
VKLSVLSVVAAALFSSCTTSYPYLITTNNCNCERFVYRDERGRFEIEISASYEVRDRISSTIGIDFHNESGDSLSLRQAYLKGTSTNVGYQFNGQFLPMPYVLIPPKGTYSMTLQGSDTQAEENPWLKIAGERVVIEIKGMLLRDEPIPPIVVTLVPYNPRLTS